ncbi:MFS transporter [Streptomyces sp. NPDC059398]|uniref:MFS transporter n=1 Tax=Streptomyces sp. NPDC059398 TaxID=3346820 RepID=UPI0036C8E2E1
MSSGSSSSAVPRAGLPAPSGLWRDRDFRRLWLGQAASQLGEQTSLVVLPLVAVLTLGADPGRLGVLRAVGQAPVLLLSLFAGAWVDRSRTRTVMMLTDAGRALALGGAALAGLLGGLGLPALLLVTFATGSLSVYFDVAYQASLVRLVRRDQLVRGNSALEGCRSAAQIGGPALGGALVSLLQAPAGTACSAAFFVLSFVSIGRIRRREVIPPAPRVTSAPLVTSAPPVPSATKNLARPMRVWSRIHQGLRCVARDSRLRAVGLASGAFQFSFAAVMTVYLLFLPRELHLSGAAVGLALAATGPGALLGSVLAARLPGRYGHGAVLVCAALLGDGALLCVPSLHSPAPMTMAVLLAVNFVFGTCGQLVNVTVMALRQAVTPEGMQGRVSATITFAGMGLAPLGSLLGGCVAEQWGLRTGLLVAVTGMLASPALMALSPLARVGRTLPGPRVPG